jgi:hypothetical protein
MISTIHRFAFIHIPKTGGNSIQDALRNYADDNFVSLAAHQDGVERFEIRNAKYKNLVKHSTLQDYFHALGSEMEGYRMFTTIRNPYDRLVSFYFSPHRGNVEWELDGFRKFVKSVPSIENYLSLKQSFFSPSKVAVSRIERFLKFENLAKDFSDLTTDLGIENVELAHRNKSVFRRNYQDCYDDELIKWVRKKHKLEIALGNYEF